MLDILANLITTARLVGVTVSLTCLLANSLTCPLACSVTLQALLAARVRALLAVPVHFFRLLQGLAPLRALVLELVLILLFLEIVLLDIINLFSTGAEPRFLE